jgi:hypothetical protein
MDGTGKHNVKRSKPDSGGHRSHIFSHMWKPDLKDKCIHKYISDHIYIYVYIYGETDRQKQRQRQNDCNSGFV